MKRKITFLIAALCALTLITQSTRLLGQEKTTFTGTFTKITSEEDFETGFYVITGSESASITNKALGSSVDGNKRVTGVEVTISGTTITNPSDAVVYYITRSDNICTFKNVNTGKYLYQSSTTSGKGMGFKETSENITLAAYNTNSPKGFRFTLNGASNNFLKWNNSSSWYANYANDYTTSMSPVTLYKCPAYNVTYNANGGSGTMTDSNNPYASGATVTVKDNTFTAPLGKVFSGWNTAADGSGTPYAAGATFAISANTTLYARWADAGGDYITVTPTSATPSCAKQYVDFSIDTDQSLDDNPTVFYTTSAGTSSTTAPAWIDGALYYDGTLTVSVKQNKTSSARTAYFRVEKGSVKSDVITITQAAFTLPAPSFDPESGTVIINEDVVLLESDTTGATIYYTMGATPADPTTSSSVYDPEEGIAVDASTTIKAIAVKYNISSAVATASYTVVNPLTTMDAIFTAATTAGSTAADTYITLGDWVVSGVSTDEKTAYITDGSGKGFIAYYGSKPGFAAGNVLSNTVHADLKLYKGAAEFTNLTTSTSGIGVTTGGTVSAITNKTIADLSGVCTGGVYTLNGLTYNSSTQLLSDGVNTIKPFNQLYSGMSFVNGKTYNVTGVYCQFDETKEILPRGSGDIVLTPGVTASVASISNFTYNVGGGPDVKSFSVSGSNLTNDLTVTATGNYKVCKTSDGTYTSSVSYEPTTGTVASTTVYVRLEAGLSSNTYEGTATVASTGAVSKVVNLTGTVTHVIAYDGSLPTGCSVSSEPNGSQVAGESVSVSATAGSGYKFTGWDVYKTGESSTKVTVTDNAFTMPSYNVTVSATFVEAYSVTYDGNGSTGGSVPVDANSPYVPNATVTVLGNTGSLVKTGYTFSNWNTADDGSGTNYSADATFNITESTILYAKWTPNQYNVALSFVANVDLSATWGVSGELAEGEDADVDCGTEITLSATNMDAGKVFVWAITDDEDNDVTEDVLDGDVLTVPAYNITIGGQVAELFFKYSGDLTEGDYIIANGNNAMKNTLNSKKFNRQSISPSNNQIIVADASSYLWHIASSGDYWTIYNAAEEKYAVSTGTASQIDLGGNSDDKCLFSVSGTTTYTFENKYNKDQSVNAYLRDGGTYWACYASGTANTLYKKAVGSKHSVAIAAGITNGNPSASPSKAYEGQTVALTPNPSSGYMLDSWDVYKTGDASTKITVKNNSFVMPGYDVTVSATFRLQHTYTLVDGSTITLVPGKHYIIASTNSTNYYVMGAQNGSVRNSVPASLSGSQILEDDDFYEVVISGDNTNKWTMYSVKDEGYLYATGAGSANINVREDNVTTNPTYGQWSISVSSGTATITSVASVSYNKFTYNHNGGTNPRFACYSTAQTAVKLYVRDGDTDLEFYSPTTITTNVTIADNEVYTVEKGQVLTFSGTLTNNGDASNLIIEDGGQLIASNSVPATVKKTITSASTKDADQHWYTISTPAHKGSNNYVVIDETNLTSGDYDMFYLDETQGKWINKKTAGGGTGFDNMNVAQGYLYRSNTTSLEIAGNTNTGDDITYTLTKTGDGAISGFNLLGNPYPHDITLKHITYDKGSNLAGFYRLSNAGAWGSELDDEEPIHSYEGFLVQSDDNGKVATFHETAQRGAKSNGDNIKFIVANSEYSDATYALFDDCFGLNKINHRNSYIPMLYINQNNEDFAIAPMSDDTKSFNLNFKAMTTGKYTLSYKAKGEFNYLHIIDRITGEDVDMLLEGEYSFIASPNDSDNRFIVKLGYNAENNANNDIFAYQNGNDIVVEGEGELQVFDVTGRMVKIQRINGVQTINLNTQGVYIFRLNEKTQKIVVE